MSNEPPRKYEQNAICLIATEYQSVEAHVDTMVDESRPESGYLVRLTIASESHDTTIWLDRSGALTLSNALYEAAGAI